MRSLGFTSALSLRTADMRSGTSKPSSRREEGRAARDREIQLLAADEEATGASPIER